MFSSVRMAHVFITTALALLSVQQDGCDRTYRFDSPDGDGAVLIRGTGNLGDSDFDVLLVVKGQRDIRLAPVRRDCWLSFAHVVWAERSRKVAVYLGDGLCGDTWIAYDRDQRRFLPFADMAEAMRASLRRTYQLSPDHLHAFAGDPLKWANGSGRRGSGAPDPAAEAFHARFP